LSRKLYIVGNGFDIHHGIPSRYSDFKEYLSNVNGTLHDHVIKYLQVEENWCDLESAFAYLDVDSVIDEGMQFLQNYSADNWSDSFHHDYQYEMGKIVSNLSSGLKIHFCEWVRLLKMKSIEELICQPVNIDRDGLFLTFNYTLTLERTYCIRESNVKHIHGKSDDDESEIILGHSWSPEEIPNLNDVSNPEDMDTRIMEGNELINDYFGDTFKPADKIVRENYSFFNSLKNVEEVIVLGHSLSEVDIRYFEEVLINVKDNAKWIVTFYGDSELKSHKMTMAGLGVKNVKFCGLSEIR